MEEDIVIDSRLKDLLDVLRDQHIGHVMRTNTLDDERWTLKKIVDRVKELGESGVNDLRRLLAPGSTSDLFINLGAAQALAALEDAGSLGLVIYQAAVLWDRCVEKGGGLDATIHDFLTVAKKLIPIALKNGPLPEGVIKALTIFTEGIIDSHSGGYIFETAAVTGHPQLKEALMKAAYQSRYKGLLQDSRDDWELRAAALFALRHFPDMQASMLEAMDHPREAFARAAARAMVEMLGILKDCREWNFDLWKEQAMEKVPPELKPKIGKGLMQKLRGELVYDRRQFFFWDACRDVHYRVRRP